VANRGPLRRATPAQLAALAPLSTLAPGRLAELAELAHVERAPRGSDPLQGRVQARQSVYLLQGELLLVFQGSGTEVLVGGTDTARAAVNRSASRVLRTKAITDVDLLVIDDEVLDIVATWDQAAAAAEPLPSLARAAQGDARLIGNAFSIVSLRAGALAQLPAAHIDELFKRFVHVRVQHGETVIREGDEGDYYYVVESGRFQVERMVGGAKVALAELRSGDPFGEEALVSEAKRNASVYALSDGALLRLARQDFNALLREPLLHRVGYAEACEKVRQGAMWLDVRYPSEYQYDKLVGAINVPLAEVRNMFDVLDRSREYIAYCQSGRRSAAAAFLFAQRGFRVWVLDGGLKQAAAQAP
jgi:rhodanese-related sulfurtransferase